MKLKNIALLVCAAAAATAAFCAGCGNEAVQENAVKQATANEIMAASDPLEYLAESEGMPGVTYRALINPGSKNFAVDVTSTPVEGAEETVGADGSTATYTGSLGNVSTDDFEGAYLSNPQQAIECLIQISKGDSVVAEGEDARGYPQGADLNADGIITDAEFGCYWIGFLAE